MAKSGVAVQKCCWHTVNTVYAAAVCRRLHFGCRLAATSTHPLLTRPLMLPSRFPQYSFPPSAVGETGRVGAPGRREVGHGNLAGEAMALWTLRWVRHGT